MRILLSLIVLLIVTLYPLSALAQDGGELQCSDAEVDTALDTIAQLVTDAQEATTLLDKLTLLVEMRQELNIIEQCQGLTFEGNSATVHGPISLPGGIYRVSVETSDYIIMSVLSLEGECNEDEFSDTIFSESGDGTIKSYQAIMQVSDGGCEGLFETELVDEPYTVTFELIR